MSQSLSVLVWGMKMPASPPSGLRCRCQLQMGCSWLRACGPREHGLSVGLHHNAPCWLSAASLQAVPPHKILLAAMNIMQHQSCVYGACVACTSGMTSPSLLSLVLALVSVIGDSASMHHSCQCIHTDMYVYMCTYKEKCGADFVVAKLAELLGVLLGSPHAVPRFARQALLPQAVLLAAGLSGLVAGRTKLTGKPAACSCWAPVLFQMPQAVLLAFWA